MNARTFGFLLLVNILAVSSVSGEQIHEAAKVGDLADIKQFVGTGTSVDERDVAERTALSWAVEKRHLNIVRYLIEKGANVNSRDFAKLTPLNYAVLSGDKDIVEVLVKNGADVNVQDDDGVTVLDDATRYGHVEITNILKASGAKCGTSAVYSC